MPNHTSLSSLCRTLHAVYQQVVAFVPLLQAVLQTLWYVAETNLHDDQAGLRGVCRFWVLEVVARMPYFSYISMLHLYESLGWWRAGAELRRVSCINISMIQCL